MRDTGRSRCRYIHARCHYGDYHNSDIKAPKESSRDCSNVVSRAPRLQSSVPEDGTRDQVVMSAVNAQDDGDPSEKGESTRPRRLQERKGEKVEQTNGQPMRIYFGYLRSQNATRCVDAVINFTHTVPHQQERRRLSSGNFLEF